MIDTANRAFLVWIGDREQNAAVYTARSAGAARYDALLNLQDCYPDLTFADLRVRRAPGYDRIPRNCGDVNGWAEEHVRSALENAQAVEDWNAAHPLGTPVVVRLDGGGTLETVTRSRATLMCNHAVVWVEGIAGCYALTHVTPAVADRGGAR